MGIYFRLAYGYFQSMKWYSEKSTSAGIDRSAGNSGTFELAMKSVKEICQLTGVTRKTLFYYDRIGLLRPTLRIGSQAHKYYDDTAVETLLKIRLYRACGLQLSEIRGILEEEESGRLKLEAGIQRMLKNRREIDGRIFLARLLQTTGSSERMIRYLSALPLEEISRIRDEIVPETDLFEQLEKWRLLFQQEKDTVCQILKGRQPVPTGYRRAGLYICCILLQENAALAKTCGLDETDRETVRQWLLQEAETTLSEEESTRIREIVYDLQRLQKESTDSEAIIRTVNRLLALPFPDRCGSEEKLLAAIHLAEQQKDSASSYAAAVLIVFYLKYAFAKGDLTIRKSSEFD